MEKEGYIVKLSKCDEDCFISPIVITRKKDGSIKLALYSKIPKGPDNQEQISNAKHTRAHRQHSAPTF